MISPQLEADLQELKSQNKTIRTLSSEVKKKFLQKLAREIRAQASLLIEVNQKDLAELAPTTAPAFRDRLTLNPHRVEQMCESLEQVAVLPDPVGAVAEEKVLANGLRVQRVASPLGVILMIFESRPNVILEALSLAFKSGNSIILRGGRESKHSAASIYQIIHQTAENCGLPRFLFLGIQDYQRELVADLLRRKDLIDIVVPRGGDQLIEFVQTNAKMPIIKNDRGLCHAYIDAEVDLEMAISVVMNGKTQRPGVCNSLETVLIHQNIAEKILPPLFAATQAFHVNWYCDEASLEILQNQKSSSVPQGKFQAATAASWDTEYLDQVINCRVVKDLDEALDHIEKHSSRHSEVILTTRAKTAERFLAEVDSAAVYWNASTRFTDGFALGLGGELGISTQKLHVRGPVGLRELTSLRWIIRGQGQVRP